MKYFEFVEIHGQFTKNPRQITTNTRRISPRLVISIPSPKVYRTVLDAVLPATIRRQPSAGFLEKSNDKEGASHIWDPSSVSVDTERDQCLVFCKPQTCVMFSAMRGYLCTHMQRVLHSSRDLCLVRSSRRSWDRSSYRSRSL